MQDIFYVITITTRSIHVCGGILKYEYSHKDTEIQIAAVEQNSCPRLDFQLHLPAAALIHILADYRYPENSFIRANLQSIKDALSQAS